VESVGLAFKTGTKRVEVAALGRKHRQSCPDGSATTGPVVVRLFKAPAAGGPPVSLGVVTVKLASAAAGEYAYTALPTPVMLDPNTVYYLLTDQTAGGQCWAGEHVVTPDDRLGITVLYPAVEKDGALSTMAGKPKQSLDSLNMTVSS
jgi:hypothetical protein